MRTAVLSSSAPARDLSVKLNGKNYDFWANAVSHTLNAQELLPLVEGRWAKPARTAPDHRAWMRANSDAAVVIFNTCDLNAARHITGVQNAATMWANLRKAYKVEGIQSVYQATRNLIHITSLRTTTATHFSFATRR